MTTVCVKNAMLKLNLFLLLITISLFALSTPKIPGSRKLLWADADITEFPYQVSLRRDDSSETHVCGGAILNESFIITARHCVDIGPVEKKYNSYTGGFFIVAGQRELTLHSKSIKRVVLDAFKHGLYKEFNHQYDVALLELREKLPPFTKSMQPIKLNDKKVVDNTKCTVTGWGQLAYHTFGRKRIRRKLRETLKKSEVITRTAEFCFRKYKDIDDSKKSKRKFFKGVSFCTQSLRGDDEKLLESQQYCDVADDSGGPLVCNGLLTGIVSYGTACDVTAHPGIYFDVQANSDWINYRENSKDLTKPNDTFVPRRLIPKGRKRKNSSSNRFSFDYLCLLIFVIACMQ